MAEEVEMFTFLYTGINFYTEKKYSEDKLKK